VTVAVMTVSPIVFTAVRRIGAIVDIPYSCSFYSSSREDG
jgi:hypothetical protein